MTAIGSGSLTLRAYLKKRRAGMPTEQAAAEVGMSIAEARLHDEAEREGEYDQIDTTETPRTVSQQSTDPAAGMIDQRDEGRVNGCGEGQDCRPPMVDPGSPETKEKDMGRALRKTADQVVEVIKPDFDMARRIYFNDIKPAQGKVGEHAQEMSTAFKEIKKTAHIQPQAAKLSFKLVEMEESKRDDFLRSLNGLLQVFRIFIPRDLVDQAEGKDESNVIPIGESSRPSLATIPSDDSDLAGAVDWHAGLKEGDAVMIPVGEAGSTDMLPGRITFIEGDVLDVEYEDAGETVKASIPRDAVSQPGAESDEHLEAAE